MAFVSTCWTRSLDSGLGGFRMKTRRQHQIGPGPMTSARWCMNVPQASKPKEFPPWAGERAVSQLVNKMLSIGPVLKLFHFMGRNLILSSVTKDSAVKAHIGSVQVYFTKQVREEALAHIVDKSLSYPSYYLNSFHGYSEGNLSWLAAFEAYPATLAVSKRALPDAASFEQAFDGIRNSHLDAIFENAPDKFGTSPDFFAVDMGCGVGLSTRVMADCIRKLRNPHNDSSFSIVGLDASPYMLAVAEKCVDDDNISFRHGLAENTKIPDNSVDWVSMQFFVHELPKDASKAIFTEAARILKKQGVFSMIDNDPASAVLQRLPPPVFMMLKSTEPYIDQYYDTDFPKMLSDHGFVDITCTRTSPRHRTITATKG